MLFFIISNTDGVRVLVCHAIFGHWMGFCGRCFNHQQVLCLYIGWCWPIVVLHMADVIAILLWQMLFPLLCILLADVIAISLLADVIAIVGMLLGWWQMLLPLWLLLLPLVGMMYHSMADCYCHLCWLILLPCLCVAVFCGRCYCHYGWWYCHLWEWCDWQMLFTRVADGIAYQGGCVVRCYNHMWADGIATKYVNLFQLKLWLLNRTLSHMWGRWYLPMFLFRDGLLTFIYRASFIGSNKVLVFPPYYAKVVNVDFMTWSAGMIIYRGRSLLMFLETFSKSSCWFPNVLLIALHPITTMSVHDSTFFQDDLCPWEPLGGFWWQVLLWSAPVPHTSYMIFLCFHLDLIVWNHHI